MKNTITMGNDEFILYVRKNYNCSLTNDRIGKLVWSWILNNSKEIDKTKDIERNVPCLWQNSRLRKTFGFRLPRTASQITFNRKLLPKLFSYLDQLGEIYRADEQFDFRKRIEEEEHKNMPELDC